MTRHIEVIADILKSAADMSADLRNDPAGLMRLGAQTLSNQNATTYDLQQTLFVALAWIGARHHKRITNQLREYSDAARKKMN